MARRARILGAEVLLGGPAGPALRGLLPDGIRYATEMESDETHYIMEFAQGTTVGDATAPRANRAIVSADAANAALAGMEEWTKAINRFRPDVIILSGLQLAEAMAEEERAYRFDDAIDAWRTAVQFSTRPASTQSDRFQSLSHVELASSSNDDFLADVMAEISVGAESLGLNELEFAAAYTAMGFEIKFEAPADGDVGSWLAWLWELVRLCGWRTGRRAGVGAPFLAASPYPVPLGFVRLFIC